MTEEKTAAAMLIETMGRLATEQEPRERFRDSLAAVVYALDAELLAGVVLGKDGCLMAQVILANGRIVRWEV